jgi:5,10-methylenetetrahydromethanopterin reductase
VPLFVHDYRDTARSALRGGVASYARFSVMHGTVAGPVAESQRDSLTAVHDAYDMHAHFADGSAQSEQLSEEVIDAFSIAGPAGYCIERIQELREMGLSRFYLTGPGRGGDGELADASHRRTVEQILPAIIGH